MLFLRLALQNAYAQKIKTSSKSSPLIPGERGCWLVPDHLKMQFLSRAGRISTGVGYNIRNFYEPTLLAGYMYKQLKSKNGEAPVITLKNSFTILGKNTSRKFALKGGLSITYSLNKISPNNLVLYQHANYYFRKKCYTMPFIGGEYYFNNPPRRAGIFAELSTVDAYLKDFFTSEFVQFDEIWALRIGISIYFHR
jgi:hypothetical protein